MRLFNTILSLVLLLAAIITPCALVSSHYELPRPSLTRGIDSSYVSLAKKFRHLEYLKFFGIENSLDQLSVIHIGDSHIQAGILTGELRRRFSQDFGSGGRGLIMPLKLSSTNEPRDYSVLSQNRWAKGKIVDRNPDVVPGIGAMAISCEDGSVELLLHQASGGEDRWFDEVTIFHSPTSSQINTTSTLDLGMGCGQDEQGVTTTIALSQPSDSISLRSSGEVTYYGFDLRKATSGVVYHSIGINGATYMHYGRYPQIARQCALLDPRLIIVSMGTNEASGYSFNAQQFLGQVDRFVTQLKEANPNSYIILTTPAPFYRRGKEVAACAQVAKLLVDYAAQNSLAIFDGYRGAKESGLYHQESEFYSSDKIHLSQEGYLHMATMLYESLEAHYRHIVNGVKL